MRRTTPDAVPVKVHVPLAVPRGTDDGWVVARAGFDHSENAITEPI